MSLPWSVLECDANAVFIVELTLCVLLMQSCLVSRMVNGHVACPSIFVACLLTCTNCSFPSQLGNQLPGLSTEITTIFSIMFWNTFYKRFMSIWSKSCGNACCSYRKKRSDQAKTSVHVTTAQLSWFGWNCDLIVSMNSNKKSKKKRISIMNSHELHKPLVNWAWRRETHVPEWVTPDTIETCFDTKCNQHLINEYTPRHFPRWRCTLFSAFKDMILMEIKSIIAYGALSI